MVVFFNNMDYVGWCLLIMSFFANDGMRVDYLSHDPQFEITGLVDSRVVAGDLLLLSDTDWLHRG